MQAPLIPIVLAFILGIIIGNFLQIPNTYLLFALCIALFFLLLYPFKKWKIIALCSLAVSFTILGILGINSYLHVVPGPIHVRNLDYRGTIGLEGTICENPVRTPEKTDLTIDATRIVQNGIGVPVEGKVLLSVHDRTDLPSYGDLVRAKVKLKHPHNFNNPGGFDYVKYLRLKGILVRAYLEKGSGIVVIRGQKGNPFLSRIEAFRDRLRTLIRAHAPPEQSPILIAMVLGEQNEIPKEVMAKFNRTGTTHILAISGFNIGIISVIFIVCFRFFLKSSENLLLNHNVLKIATFLTAIPVIFYSFIAGLGMSVIRAALMMLAMVAAVVFGKARYLPNILALAAFLMLAFLPPALFDVSFQLSFVSVASILFIVPRFTGLLRPDPEDNPLHPPGKFHSIINCFYLFLLVTIAATVGVIPLTTYYFNTLSLTVIAGNMLLIPIMGYGVVVLSLAVVLAAPFSDALSVFFIQISSYLIKISVLLADRLSSLPHASVYVTTPTLIEICAYYFLLAGNVVFLDCILNRRFKEISRLKLKLSLSVSVAMLVFFIADGFYLHNKDSRPDRLAVTFIDVGQGNSTLISLPGGKKMLIDGGGSYDDRFDIGKNVLAPFLWGQKIKAIDTVILTHPHPDHLNGLLFILENFSVREVWSNGQEVPDEAYLKFKEMIKEKQIRHRILSNKSVLKQGDVIFRIMNPDRHGKKENKTEPSRRANDESLVVKLSFHRISFLFPGDISARTEQKMMDNKQDLHADVLLAPHHGSRFSNSPLFIKKVRPETVIFSCGKENIFGLPAHEVIDRYGFAGVEIFRTDRDGAITIETDGESIRFRGFRGRGF
jgi:competence protein ComEC